MMNVCFRLMGHTATAANHFDSIVKQNEQTGGLQVPHRTHERGKSPTHERHTLQKTSSPRIHRRGSYYY